MQRCPVYIGGFASEDLHVVRGDPLAVDVGEHPGQLGIRMLQYGVDPSHLVLGAPVVVPGYDGLQHISPEDWTLINLRVELGQLCITTGFLQAQLQLRFLGIQAYRCRGIRTTNALYAVLRPVLDWQFLGIHQPRGRVGFAGIAVK